MKETSDHELMTLVARGQVNRLGDLFERHHRHLFNFFMRQTGNRHVSEDLVQDVFYRILKYNHTYRAEGKFTTWMFAIAHNTLIDTYRKNRIHMESLESAGSLAQDGPSPEEHVIAHDQKDKLHRAINMLPPEKREILILSKFQQCKYEEISKILGCRIGTVKARVFRALKELQTIYQSISETRHVV